MIVFRHRHLLPAITVCLLVTIFTGIYGLRTVTAAKPHWPHEQSDLAADPDMSFGRLANGFRYVLLENSKPENRVRMHLVVNVGAIHENEDERGIAHFLEHMLFNGSTHFAPGELVKYFQKIGMQFGPDANASTSFFRTVYDINLPQSDRASLEEALLVMSDYAEGALLLPEEIEREREVILAEKRTRDSADYRTYVASLQFELAGTRFPDRLPIGTEEVIRNADRKTFKAFYDAWYRPDNMILVMVGDFDTAVAGKLVKARFAGMRPRAEAPPEPETGSLKQDTPTVFYHYEPEAGNTTVALQALQPVSRRVETRDDKKARMEARLIGSMLQARIDRRLNQPKPPFTEASAGIGRFLREFQYGYISADCQPQNWKATLFQIEGLLRQALEHGFDAIEVDRARRDFMAELERRVDQAATRDSGMLARMLIHSLTSDRVFQSPRQEMDFYAPLLAAVTPDDLNTRLRQAWPENGRKITLTGNTRIASEGADPAAVIDSAYLAATRQPVAAPEIAKAVRFPYRSPPPSATAPPVHREQIEDLAITRLTLANGVRLNFKPTPFSANEILFALSLEGGRAVEPLDKPGLATLTREVLNESGVGPLDREALQIALTGKTTSLAFGFNQDRFYLKGASTPREIELLFQLLHAHMTDPAFRPDAHRLVQKRLAQDYQQLAQSIDGAFRVHGQRFLSGGDPRFGKARIEEVQRLTIADVQEWIQPILATSPLEFSMVGDFDLETAVGLARQYLGDLPAKRRHKVDVQPGPVFPKGQNKRVRIDTQIDKALLVVAYPTDDASDIRRTRRLNVLAEIFSERLREEIREKRGAAYSTGAYSWPSRAFPGFGLLLSYLPIAPVDVDPIAADVRSIAGRMNAEGIQAEELERALEPTLTGIREQLRQNRYWLQTVLMGSSRYPEQIEWSRSLLSDYSAIGVQDVNALAREYLDPDKAAVFEARPLDGEKARNDKSS